MRRHANLLPRLSNQRQRQARVCPLNLERGQAAQHVTGKQTLPSAPGPVNSQPVIDTRGTDIVQVTMQPRGKTRRLDTGTGARMSSYRRMGRQARHARRNGMQPMMVINSGDPFPELAIVVIARWVWRYRSELAPVGVAVLLAAFGWFARRALSSWWPLILASSGISAWVLGGLAAWFGVPARLERLYLAVTVLACGTWGTLAAAIGPFTSPLPQALGIGGLVLSVPWWVNRRRRAKVRVERTIAIWPDIAEGHRAYRLADPVRDRGLVGMACPARPGTWPDHH